MRSNSRRRNARTALLALGAWLALWFGPSPALTRTAPRQSEPAQSSPQTQSSPQAQSSPQVHAHREFLVIVDPSHGGDDPGATLPGLQLEKDVTLSLARVLRQELENRGVAVRLLRESDVGLSLEQRAAAVNEARPGLYVAIHAGSPGAGARVYMPWLAMSPANPNGPFLPWDSAQAAAIAQSDAAAKAVAAEIGRSGMNVREIRAPLRPLNNVAAPAIAVEWATDTQSPRPQPSQKVEMALASAIASGIVQARNQMGLRP